MEACIQVSRIQYFGLFENLYCYLLLITLEHNFLSSSHASCYCCIILYEEQIIIIQQGTMWNKCKCNDMADWRHYDEVW